ncbi:MAG: LysR family transcriptional regulator [Bacteroidales bacterium]
MITTSNRIEFRHLRYFLTVARELHFRKAADKLFISQPGLSRQIQQLEEESGIQLFERNNRKVQLTPAGYFLKQEIELIFKNLDQAIFHAKLLNDGKEGNISFGYVGSAIQEVIPDLLIGFKKKHPNIRFNLKEMDNQRQVESLFSKEIDIGFARLDSVPKGLAIKQIKEENFSLVIPAAYPVDKSNFKNLLQFKNEPFILFDKNYSATYFETVMQIFEYSGFTPSVTHSTVHAGTIYKLVENNFGVSIVPTSLQINYNSKLRFIELTEIPFKATLSAIWSLNNRNPLLNEILRLLEI